MYEPVHGSAPDIAGEGVANPLASIASVAMMFRFSFGNEEAAQGIESALEAVLEAGFRTKDLHSGSEQLVSTSEMGSEIRKHINQN
jgi:3-isopropylmalate dehydrogenase